MLIELHIENLGVIERASLQFPNGLTALTGETGAGKTMLIEAIDLLVGGRADSTMVRSGAPEARVDGRLSVEVEGGRREVVLTRVVPADGRSRAYIDGRPATVAQLAEITATEIDLHGQHAHQSLLSSVTQRNALDAYGDVDKTRLRAAQGRLTEIDAELAALGGDERARAREIDLLRYQVDELDAANIEDPVEDERLAAEESTLSDAVSHREAGESALAVLRDGDGAAEALSNAIARLGDRAPYAEPIERLTGLVAELDDVIAAIRDTAESIEEDPARLDEIRVRRALLVDLRRKYGDDLAAVIEFHTDASRRLVELSDYDRRAAELDRQREAALSELREAARDVGAQRAAAAPQLGDAVQRQLAQLAMPNAQVTVSFAEDPNDLAHDQVTFLLSANPGSPMLPLSKVASGGELARSMLALRLVLSERKASGGVATLVFDEVDAGIGGTAAGSVGKALGDLADHHQVLVVTHLPQVAALADQQLVVSKQVADDATFTEVHRVGGEDRVDELARMLSGESTTAARDHARELLGHRLAGAESRDSESRDTESRDTESRDSESRP